QAAPGGGDGGPAAAPAARAANARISAQGGLRQVVADRLAEIDARGVNSIPLFDDVVVRVGRYGPYLQKGDADGGQRASVPEDLPPDELTAAKAQELLSAPSGDRALGVDPGTGREITVKAGRYGPYITDGERTASLFKTMSLDTVGLDDALRLLTLPRALGADEAGNEITAQNGRYGPYISRSVEGKLDSRSLDAEDQLFTVTLDAALALFAQPKTRGRRGPAAPPLKELGVDPVSGKPMVVKDGRFGPYVTDGETNASLRRGDSVDELTDERAIQLLAERRERGPAPRKAARKTAAKKAPAKKTAAKKTAAAASAAAKTPAKAAPAKASASRASATGAAPRLAAPPEPPPF
ncbi:MAG: DNA topoisomerase I, partial [Frankiaceae bacterium]|nr:DNA topoisomerase I [Frankiaceae bacterium]